MGEILSFARQRIRCPHRWGSGCPMSGDGRHRCEYTATHGDDPHEDPHECACGETA